MDRQIVYPGQIPLDTDILSAEKNALIGLAKLAGAVLGTSTLVNGLACIPTGPASLQVVVNPGEIYSLVGIDATGYGSLPIDTTHTIMKQGILLDAVTLSCPAPGTGGNSINYLVQAVYQDSDALPVVLPYFNASNPAQAFSGPNNSGSSQNTVRKGVCTVNVKSGVSAPTGSQITPTADAGFTGLWVVTVANGQATITAGNIVQLAGAPFNQGFLPVSGGTVAGSFALSGVLSPAQITSNQNDYTPPSIATANTLRLSSNARLNVTGLSGGAAGRVQIIHNVGTFPIVFTYLDVLSLAANRFAFGMTLGGGQSMEIQYDATSALWRAKSLPEPIGTIKSFGGGTLPAGYLLRDGSNLSRTTFAALFNEVGTAWGVGDGSTTFGVGDDRRRVTVGSGGAGTGTLGNAVGNTGGEEAHPLTGVEGPSHGHLFSGFSGSADGSEPTTGVVAKTTTGGTTNIWAAGGNETNSTIIASSGSGTAHNIIQPSNVVTKMIRYC